MPRYTPLGLKDDADRAAWLLDWKYADKIGLLKLLASADDFDQTLETIEYYAHQIKRLDDVRLVPLAAVFIGQKMTFSLDTISIGGDGPKVTPEDLATAIREADAARTRGDDDGLVEVGIRDGWVDPPDDEDDEDDDDPVETVSADDFKCLETAPPHIAELDWSPTERVALFRAVAEIEDSLPSDEIEAATHEAIAECKDNDRDDRWATKPSEVLPSILRRRQVAHLLSSRPMMVEKIMERFEVEGQATSGQPFDQIMRDRLTAADESVLVLLTAVAENYTDRLWTPAWIKAVDPGNENPDGSETKAHREAVALDRQIDGANGAVNPKLARLRELEGQIGGA